MKITKIIGLLTILVPNILLACPYSLPLDEKPSIAAYSIRALSSKWIGKAVVQLRRSSDNKVKRIAVSPNTCSIDIKDKFFDGSTYHVVTWYDQSGNESDLYSNNKSNEPIFLLNCVNNQPCTVYNGENRYLGTILSESVNYDTFIAVANLASNNRGKYIAEIGDMHENATSINYSLSSKACVSLRWGHVVPSKELFPCEINKWYSWLSTQTENASSLSLNTIEGTNDIKGKTDSHIKLIIKPSKFLYVGEASTNDYMWQGEIAELIVFKPLSTWDGRNISSNQMDFFDLK